MHYRAKRLPVQLGPAAWDDILGPRSPAPPLDGRETADVVVIGGGFAGLTAARRVKQLDPTAKVIVVEAGQIAKGAAGRNSGFMIDLPHDLTSDDYAGSGDDRVMIRLNRQAIQFGRDAVAEYGIDPNYFDACGKVNGAASPRAHQHNQTYAAHLASLGESSEALDAQQMTELTGSRHYSSGLYTSGTVVLQPAGYIRGLATGLTRSGVKIFENSPVTEFTKDLDNWTVKTAKGQVSTGKIILSVNGHLESFGVQKGRLMQLFLYASMTPDLDQEALAKLGGASRWGITPSDPMGTTMRRIDTAQGGNRIVTRTCALLKPDMTPSSRDMARAARVMQRKFDSRFPQLAGLKMEHVWAGHLCLSMNGVSVMREIDEGVFSACVQNGLGTARGTLTGIGAAELACGVGSEITAHFAQEAAPSRLPPQPFRQIGANAVLRWQEHRARSE